MLWEAERVIVEYDGIVHLTEEQRRRDAARRNVLQQAGYYLIVFTARDLRHPEAMINLVQSALRERGAR
jgi:very-short-patch-repair endonuclease